MKTVITVTLNPALDKTIQVEQFIYGGLNRIIDTRIDAGGKGINVAKVLRQFAINVTAWGVVAGQQGKLLRDKLHQLGISTHLLEAEGETRTNQKIVDLSTRETTELNEQGFSVTPELLEQFAEQFDAELANGQTAAIVLGGSLPAGAPPSYYATLLQIAAKHQVPALLDADGVALVQGLAGKPFAIKPNIHELEELIGERFSSDEEIVNASRKLIDQGLRYVLVSMGGKGSLLVSAHNAYRALPFPIEPQSTVGAGDSMVGALVYGILHQYSTENLARVTSAAGTVTASKAGTQVCSLDEVQQHIGQVHLTCI